MVLRIFYMAVKNVKLPKFSSKGFDIFFGDFNQIWIFSTDFSKSVMSNYIQICPVGVEMIHEDRGTDGQT